MDTSAFIWRMGFLFEALALLFIAKVVRDLLLLRKGYRTDQHITEHDNVAASIDLAGFLLGTMIALLDSFVIEGESWIAQASSIAYTGLFVISFMFLNSLICDFLIFRGLDDDQEIYDHRNLALASARAGAMIATGLMIRAAFGHPNPWLLCMMWAVIGQLGLVIMAQAYQWISPYDDLQEIKKGNLAAGLPFMGVLIAVGLTLESAIYGEAIAWQDELIAVGIYIVVGSLLLWGVRFLFNVIFLPKSDLDDEIVKDQNVGVGLLEATLYIAMAEVINFFLS